MPRHTPLSLLMLVIAVVSTPAHADQSRPQIGTWQTIPAPIPVPRPSIGRWVTNIVPARPDRSALTTASLPRTAAPSKPLVGAQHELAGIASFYWQDQMTASGERFDRRAMTAAHKTLPLGTRVRVTHMSSGRTVVVRINDRGPFKPGRVIDLSEAAAEQIGMVSSGLAAVMIEVVQ